VEDSPVSDSGPAALFREIHRLRRFARELEDQIKRFPIQVKAQQAKVTRTEDAFREGQEAIKRLKVSMHEKEVTLKTTIGDIKKHEKQLNEASGKKEYDALQSEIATGKSECRKLEDEILEAIAESEDRTAKLPELEKAVAQAKQDYTKWEDGAKQKRSEQEAMLKETQAKVQELEAGIPDTYRTRYQRAVNAFGSDAFASAKDRACGQCRTEITQQMHFSLLAGSFVVCEVCERILYLPGD
jgi:predicted  nucleic acid-binding Zn-ribbon protein